MGDPWLTVLRASKGRPEQTLLERFWSYVEREGKCLVWTGHRLHFGHGFFASGRKYLGECQTHRIAFMLHHGLKRLRRGDLITHRCDNPPCLKEDHLVLGTHASNNLDMDLRFRRQRGEDRPTAKLTDGSVKEARELHAAGWTTVALADRYDVAQATIWAALARKTWKHV